MKTTNTATANAMKVLTAVMVKGKTDEATAVKALRDAHACALTTLARAGLVWHGLGVVMTAERRAEELVKAEKRAMRAELKAKMVALQKEMDSIK